MEGRRGADVDQKAAARQHIVRDSLHAQRFLMRDGFDVLGFTGIEPVSKRASRHDS